MVCICLPLLSYPCNNDMTQPVAYQATLDESLGHGGNGAEAGHADPEGGEMIIGWDNSRFFIY